MKTEFLKEMGLEQEQIDKIMAENGKDIEKYKSQAEGSKSELEGLKTQLSERDKQLKDLQDGAGDNAELKKQIEDLQKINKEQKASYEKQVQETKFHAALDAELLKAEALDSELVKVKLNQDKLTLKDDGAIEGLKEQLDGLKESHGFLFKQAEAVKLTGAEPANKAVPTNKKPEEMTYSEMIAYMANNPGAKIN